MRIVTNTTNTTPGDLAAENARLRRDLAQVTAERDRLSEQLVAAEAQGASLVKLYVSNRRLNEAADRGDALEAIKEVIISVLGCEEFAILAHDAAASRLTLAASFGIDDSFLRASPLRSAVIRSVVDSGRAHYAARAVEPGRSIDRDEMTACVPLTAGNGRVVGAIALYGLLPHRGELDQNDRALLDLVSIEAARAMTGPHTRAAAAA